jgi:ferredoxin
MTDDYDFLSELNNLYNKTEHSVDKNADVDVCLISLEKLEANHITLNCKHKYNLVPLFNYLSQEMRGGCIYCPYCLQNTNNTLPIRNINGTYIYNKKVNLPLEKCITDEHKCNKCGSCLGFNGSCIRHHKYFEYLYDMLPDEKKHIIEAKINLIETKFKTMLNTSKYFIYDMLFDDIILDNLEITLLKLICKKYELEQHIQLTNVNKYELINYIKMVDA